MSAQQHNTMTLARDKMQTFQFANGQPPPIQNWSQTKNTKLV